MVQFGRPSLVHFRRHIPVQLRPSLDSDQAGPGLSQCQGLLRRGSKPTCSYLACQYWIWATAVRVWPVRGS